FVRSVSRRSNVLLLSRNRFLEGQPRSAGALKPHYTNPQRQKRPKRARPLRNKLPRKPRGSETPATAWDGQRRLSANHRWATRIPKASTGSILQAACQSVLKTPCRSLGAPPQIHWDGEPQLCLFFMMPLPGTLLATGSQEISDYRPRRISPQTNCDYMS